MNDFNISHEKPTVDDTFIETNKDAKDGQNKCPKCGASDIALNPKSGLLRCNFCRYEFAERKLDVETAALDQLKGEHIGLGAKNIVENSENIITLKCSSCGAEVVIDTANALQARCHWCRHTLSLNQQIPNGAIPDTVLPFRITKQEAKAAIEKFVSKRKTFALNKFKKEFVSDNVMGVYLPYMIVDANIKASLQGQGERQVRSYVVKQGKNRVRYYDADLYDVIRSFNLTVDDLTIESSQDKLNVISRHKTNDIINSIMPFDTENCVKWDANYLRGFTSEKRDININELTKIVDNQLQDIARFAAKNTIKAYDRGVCWENEQMEVVGRRWYAAYLPVWLYSYQETKGHRQMIHYVAVNARTQETMGSVPINQTKLFLVALLIEIFGAGAGMYLADLWDEPWPYALFVSGFVFYFFIYQRYRNQGVRHTYEQDTKARLTNLEAVDEFVEHRYRLRSNTMYGANQDEVRAYGHYKNILSFVKDLTDEQ